MKAIRTFLAVLLVCALAVQLVPVTRIARADDIITIAAARADSNNDGTPDLNGKTVTVKGIVTIDDGIIGATYTSTYIQDETGGINVYNAKKSTVALKAGDLVQATGTIQMYSGALELSSATFQVLSSGNALPTAKKVTLKDIQDPSIEGTLVTFSGIVTSTGGPTSSGRLFINIKDDDVSDFTCMPFTRGNVDVTKILKGTKYTFTGIATRYLDSSTGKTKYEAIIRGPDDIQLYVEEKDTTAPDPVTNVVLASKDVTLTPGGSKTGIDGTDFAITWIPAAAADNTFNVYRIFILPDGASLDVKNDIPFGVVSGQTTGTFTGTDDIVTDGKGNKWLSGASYVAYVLAEDKAMNQSAATPSKPAVITLHTAPEAVTLSSPANGSTIDTLTPVLAWSKAVGATSYKLQIANAADFTTITHEESAISGTSTTLAGGILAGNHTYYWRVAAANDTGTSDWSTAFSFTTRKMAVTVTLTLVLGSTTMHVTDTAGANRTETLEAPATLGAGNRTLVPIRAVAEALGGTVGWNAATKTATVTVGSNTLELIIGKSMAKLNGAAKQIDTDPKVVPTITNGRTLLPLRFVTESLGADVAFDQATKTITITFVKP